MIESVCSDVKKEKHIELYNAIQCIDNIIQDFDSLLYRIEGPIPENSKCETPKNPDPALIDVLNGGANLINDKIDSIRNRITRLHELLF